METYKNLQDLYEKNPKAFKQLYATKKDNRFFGSMSDYHKEYPELPIYLEDERKNITGVLGGIGMKLKGTVLKISKDTILLGFNDGQKGRLEKQDFTWGSETESLMNFFKVGDELRVVVIDNDGCELSLSRKYLYDNTWLYFINRYKVGDKIKVAITAIKKTKLLVTVEELCIKELDPLTVLAGEITFRKSMRKSLRTDLAKGLVITANIIKIDAEREILILQSDDILYRRK